MGFQFLDTKGFLYSNLWCKHLEFYKHFIGFLSMKLIIPTQKRKEKQDPSCLLKIRQSARKERVYHGQRKV